MRIYYLLKLFLRVDAGFMWVFSVIKQLRRPLRPIGLLRVMTSHTIFITILDF